MNFPPRHMVSVFLFGCCQKKQLQSKAEFAMIREIVPEIDKEDLS